MYPSDYGYATSGGATTNRETCLAKELYNWDSSSYSDCKNNDWLFNSSTSQWTMHSYHIRSDIVLYINYTGCIYNDYPRYLSLGVRPSLYLSSNVSITSGNGTQSSPYTLSN